MSHKRNKNILSMKKGGLKSMLHHSNSRHQRVKTNPTYNLHEILQTTRSHILLHGAI